MKFIETLYLAVITVLLLATVSYAESKPKFSIGLAYIGGGSIYSNVKFRSTIMPTISYKSETLTIGFFEGLAYKFFDGDTVSMTAAVTPKGRPYKSTRSANLIGMKRDMYYDGSLEAS